jgi:hypothetical protein
MPAKHTVYFEFEVKGGEPTAEQKKAVASYFKKKLGSKVKALYHANNRFSVRGSTDDEDALTKTDCQVVLSDIYDREGFSNLAFSPVENFKTTSSAQLRGKKGGTRRRRSRRGTMRR